MKIQRQFHTMEMLAAGVPPILEEVEVATPESSPPPVDAPRVAGDDPGRASRKTRTRGRRSVSPPEDTKPESKEGEDAAAADDDQEAEAVDFLVDCPE